LNNSHAIRHYKNRSHDEKIPIQYTNRPIELRRHLDIKHVFEKLDEDGSNCLEIDELDLMFKQNGIPIT
jgi:hypothetical protein